VEFAACVCRAVVRSRDSRLFVSRKECRSVISGSCWAIATMSSFGRERRGKTCCEDILGTCLLWCIVSGDGESCGIEAAKVGQERRGMNYFPILLARDGGPVVWSTVP